MFLTMFYFHIKSVIQLAPKTSHPSSACFQRIWTLRRSLIALTIDCNQLVPKSLLSYKPMMRNPLKHLSRNWILSQAMLQTSSHLRKLDFSSCQNGSYTQTCCEPLAQYINQLGKDLGRSVILARQASLVYQALACVKLLKLQKVKTLAILQ